MSRNPFFGQTNRSMRSTLTAVTEPASASVRQGIAYPPEFLARKTDHADMLSNREQARTAEAAADWPEASRCWSIVVDTESGDREAFLALISALHAQGLYDEADARLCAAPGDHTGHLDYAISFAQNAQMRSDLPAAIERSLALVTRFPTHIYGYGTAAILLAAANRADEGFAILSEGGRRFPDESTLFLPLIHVAVARSDWATAADGLKRVRAQFPVGHAVRTEAETFHAAIASGRSSLLQREAMDLEQSRNFEDALDLWETISSISGPTREILLGRGRCLREQRMFAEADQALRHAMSCFPGDPEIEANFAQVAAVAGDWPEAAHRWRAVLKAFPDINAFAAMAGQVFACAGDAEEAETVLDQAVEHDPVSIDLRTARAFVAQTSGNWTRAVERWNDVIRLAPDVPGFRMLLREAILRQQGKVGAGRADSQDADPDASASAADPEEKRRSLDAVTGGVSRHSLTEEELTVPMKDMVRQFESLGDNCEFGLVQRHHGAEPITLFRFVAIEPERLIELLDLDLGPLGDPDHTVVAERGNEYYVVDDRGYYWMHTFIRTQQAGAERYVKQQGARLGYLKRNFLQDLQSGEKIYVCKLSTAPISDATLMKLSGSLRRFGDNMLLGVRRADADHPPGSVERLDDHVLVGYMKSLQAEGDLGIHQESWEPVIRKVYRERSRRSAETRRDPALVPESMAV